jgi:hypothetical protein
MANKSKLSSSCKTTAENRKESIDSLIEELTDAPDQIYSWSSYLNLSASKELESIGADFEDMLDILINYKKEDKISDKNNELLAGWLNEEWHQDIGLDVH